jgi:hypothetical protein
MVDQGCAQAKKTLKFFIVGCSILNLKVLKLYPGQRHLHDSDEHQHIVIRFSGLPLKSADEFQKIEIRDMPNILQKNG